MRSNLTFPPLAKSLEDKLKSLGTFHYKERAPLVTDNFAAGYAAADGWYDSDGKEFYRCTGDGEWQISTMTGEEVQAIIDAHFSNVPALGNIPAEPSWTLKPLGLYHAETEVGVDISNWGNLDLPIGPGVLILVDNTAGVTIASTGLTPMTPGALIPLGSDKFWLSLWALDDNIIYALATEFE